jgi:hypothetical protein
MAPTAGAAIYRRMLRSPSPFDHLPAHVRRVPLIVVLVAGALLVAPFQAQAEDVAAIEQSVRLVTPDEIRSAPVEQQSHVIGCVAAALADDARSIGRLRHEDKLSDGGQRARFDAAVDATDPTIKAVRHAMKLAEHASEDSWPEARAQLANDFAAYVAAIDRVYAVARGETVPQVVARAR